jgi:hypothetical protein
MAGGTALGEILDLFMTQINDYRLTNLYSQSQEDFETYLQAWLVFSIADFDDICNQSLDYDEDNKEFSESLTSKNKIVLATLMMKYWLQKVVNDITQMNLHITDRDFKTASEAANLKEKSAHLALIKEQCSQLLLGYEYKNNTWEDWYNQEFSGG